MGRNGPNHRRLRGWIVGTLVGLGFVGTVGVASASTASQSGGGALLASMRSLAHIVGITASFSLSYYAARARSSFTGGVFGESATYVIVGAVVFGVAFVVMELDHGFGINVVSFISDMQMKMAVNMALFTITVFAFGWAFYRMASTLQGAR